MNCEPGDMAVIIRGVSTGALVTVIGPARIADHDWLIRSLRGKLPAMSRDKTVVVGSLINALDAWLRPIRPQDDDAQDESLRYLPPVPQLEHA